MIVEVRDYMLIERFKKYLIPMHIVGWDLEVGDEIVPAKCADQIGESVAVNSHLFRQVFILVRLRGRGDLYYMSA